MKRYRVWLDSTSCVCVEASCPFAAEIAAQLKVLFATGRWFEPAFTELAA